MFDEFVPLADFLSPPLVDVVASVLPAAAPTSHESLDTSLPHAKDVATESAAVFAAARRFRAAVADAVDVAVQKLLTEIAENVLARELELGPADVGVIIAKARERFANEKILVVRIHPQDREALGKLEVDTVLDERLGRGDIVAELSSGTIDLRLQARLEAALATCAP
jgi:flagellar biosynthesis/type III secretory pathway protein FliH